MNHEIQLLYNNTIQESKKKICEGNSAMCRFVGKSHGNSIKRATKFNYCLTPCTIADQLTSAIYIDPTVAIKQQLV